jgi:O-antigen/teichoic acid export membrane protein
MASNGKNVVANLIGGLIGPLIGLVMTPFYLRIIGLEGLGLVGLMALVTTVVGVFVAGISKTYQRDLSTAQVTSPEDLKGLLIGGMLIFGMLGMALGVIVLIVGRFQIQTIASETHFSVEILGRCLVMISTLLALGIITTAISCTLVSFKDQVWPSTLGIIVGLVTAIASWLSLSTWPRVDVFYVCQLGGGLIAFLFLSLRCLVVLHNKTVGITSRKIGQVWKHRGRNSGKLSLILIIHEGLGVLISQVDRILISSYFPIIALGAYNLGANPSRFVGIFPGPVNNITYPDFCKIAGEESNLIRSGEYLGRVSFILTMLFVSAMIILIPAGDDMLNAWLGKDNVPKGAPSCFILLSAGCLLLAVAGPAYNLTVAHGKVGYGIYKNTISLLMLPPLGLWFIHLWGFAGVAALPVIYALNCVLICNWFAYKRHADIRGAFRWIFGALSCLGVAAILTFGLNQTCFDGLTMILTAFLVSAMFFLIVVITFFGRSPKVWLHALEVLPTNEHRILTSEPVL